MSFTQPCRFLLDWCRLFSKHSSPLAPGPPCIRALARISAPRAGPFTTSRARRYALATLTVEQPRDMGAKRATRADSRFLEIQGVVGHRARNI